MTLTKETLVLGIDDAKIFKLLTDSSAELSYDGGVDIPGITKLDLEVVVESKKLKGDGKVLDVWVRIESAKWSWENVKIPLDALAILSGGNVTASGATPSQKQKFSLRSSNTPPNYFKLEAKSDYTDAGDVHYIMYKCKVDSLKVSVIGDDYATVSVSGEAIPTENTLGEGILDIDINETAADIVVGGTIPGALTVTLDPLDAATDVVVSSNITWTFNNAIQASDLTDANFFIMKATDGTLVAGTLSIDATQKVVSFDPTANLSASTAYIMICSKNVHDVYGQSLADNSVGNFTTAA